MMIYKDNYQIEFFIKNSCTECDIPMDKIMQKGISTKYNHSGFGLSTIHEINNNNSNMFVQYKKDQAEFTTQIILMCNRKEKYDISNNHL